MQDEVLIPVEEGLLVWDGSVLELFSGDGRSGSWRIHRCLIDRWALEPRRNDMALLTMWTTARHYESASVTDEHLPALRAVLAQFDVPGSG